MNNHGGNFRNHEHAKSFGCKIFIYFFEGCAFSGAGSTGDCYFVDREVGIVAKVGLFDHVFEIDLVHGFFELFGSKTFLNKGSLDHFFELFSLLCLPDKMKDTTGYYSSQQKFGLILCDFIHNISH